MRSFLTVLITAFLLVITSSPSFANKRVALVVGNNNYVNVTKLEKAENDADALGRSLQGLGFQVILQKNLNRRDFNRQLQRFLSQLSPGDEALFFFAGHGVEIRGQNYLLPTDIPNAAPGQESFVKSEAIGVNYVLSEIGRRKVRLSLLILDACRNNPFKQNGTRSLGRTRGLGTMEAPPEGTFILYSAGFGQSALDRLSDSDPHPNSVFTRSLVPMLTKPGLKLSEAARQLRRKVMKLASTVSHEQRPAYYDEVLGDFYFTPPPVGDTKTADPTPQTLISPPAVIPGGGTCGIWPQIATSATYAQVNAFLAECKTGIYSKLAAARLKELKPSATNKIAALPPIIKKTPPSGDAAKIFSRAWNLFNGKNGERQDYYEAVRLYRQAVDLNHASAMVNLGYAYENGFGVQKDNYEAFRLYKQAAGRGETQGMTNIGYMYETGKGTKKSLAEAVKWYRKAAEAGNANGMTNLGYMYETGRGIGTDLKQAFKWYKKAADTGLPRAQNNLAYMYLNGRGIRKNERTAFSFYQKSANKSFPNAMYMLGYMYELGKGVGKNQREAAKWVMKALKARHPFAVKEMTTNANGWSVTFRRELQRQMSNEGYYNGSIDGKFGNGTFNAVKAVAGQ
ncbi:MAG: hypothetical protein DHS20C08_15510 [Rhodomicrobium sp.]|nr:MAG: hypothetical protein DHS20C08_15510 [Rhodomicrobium sp.]